MFLKNQCTVVNFGNRNSEDLINNLGELRIIDLEIDHKKESLTKTFKFKIARFFIYDPVIDGVKQFAKFQNDFKRNDIIRITLGSDNANKNIEIAVITKAVFYKDVIEIHAEDLSYFFKGLNNISFSYQGNGNYNFLNKNGQREEGVDMKYENMLEFVKDKIDDSINFIKDNIIIPDSIKNNDIFNINDIFINETILCSEALILGQYSFGNKQKMNTAQIVKYIVKNYQYWFDWELVIDDNNNYFLTPTIKRFYLEQLDIKHKLSFIFEEKKDDYNILDYDLEYYTDKDMTIQINAKSYLQNNQVIEESYIYPEERFAPDRSIDQIFYNMNTETLREVIRERAKSNVFFGWTGDITTHGTLPGRDMEFIKVGDVVKIINAQYFNRADNFIDDEEYNEDKENYKVIENFITFNEDGIRQEIKLGNRIG